MNESRLFKNILSLGDQMSKQYEDADEYMKVVLYLAAFQLATSDDLEGDIEKACRNLKMICKQLKPLYNKFLEKQKL